MSRIRSEEAFHILNKSKRNMQQQIRFTQIERQNRMLLQKITLIRKKKDTKNETNRNKSLNSSFRQRQYQSIEHENAKMLKRLQQRKSEYDINVMDQKWRKTRSMFKHLTLHSFQKHSFATPKEVVRRRLINGVSFLVTLKIQNGELVVLADNKLEKQIKAIQLSANQTSKFIKNQCDGDLEKVFDCLRYNSQQQTLFLISKKANSTMKINPRHHRNNFAHQIQTNKFDNIIDHPQMNF